jgi:hypothetical protein
MTLRTTDLWYHKHRDWHKPSWHTERLFQPPNMAALLASCKTAASKDAIQVALAGLVDDMLYSHQRYQHLEVPLKSGNGGIGKAEMLHETKELPKCSICGSGCVAELTMERMGGRMMCLDCGHLWDVDNV